MLKLTDIHTFYGKIEAVRGISLEINKGEIVTLIGANGAGKTTTLKTISGLLKPSSGKIEFNGEDITGFPAYKIVQKGISMVPEGRKIFSRMTVKENLLMGAYTRNDKNEIEADIEKVFSLFPILKDRKNQIAGTLSGGEQQMLATGRGLMSRPKILMMDEPSMGLSPILIEKIFETIKQINSAGVTILLVEQNAHQSLKVSNRGYVIETGKIEIQGFSTELLNNDLIRKAYLGEI